MIAGVLSPRMAAAAAEMFPRALQLVVICNGVTMQTIIVDAKGERVAVTESEPCTSPALDTASSEICHWARLAYRWQMNTGRQDLLAPPKPNTLRPPGQAPPQVA